MQLTIAFSRGAGLRSTTLQSQGLACLSAAVNVVKKINYFFLPSVKGSKRKGARMKCSHCPLETSKPEHSAQPAVAIKRSISYYCKVFSESTVLDNTQETELYFPFPEV